MSYELLRHVDVDLGELGDSLQIEIDKEKKHLRLTMFQDDHYLDHITMDLMNEFANVEPRRLSPVLCKAGSHAVHHHYFGCPVCGTEVGGFTATGSGENDWSTHKDRYCKTCCQPIDWSKTKWEDIYRI